MVYPGKNSNLEIDFFLFCALRSAIFLSGRNSLLKNSKNPTKRWFFVLFSILVHLEFDENENRNQVERLHFHWIFDNLVPSEFLRLRRISLSSARSEKKSERNFTRSFFTNPFEKNVQPTPDLAQKWSVPLILLTYSSVEFFWITLFKLSSFSFIIVTFFECIWVQVSRFNEFFKSSDPSSHFSSIILSMGSDWFSLSPSWSLIGRIFFCIISILILFLFSLVQGLFSKTEAD